MKLKVTKSSHPTFKVGDVVEARNNSDGSFVVSGLDSWVYFVGRRAGKLCIGGKFGDPIVNLAPVKPELSDYEKAKRRDMWIEIGVVAVASIIVLVAGFMK